MTFSARAKATLLGRRLPGAMPFHLPVEARAKLSKWKLVAGMPVSQEINGMSATLSVASRFAAEMHVRRFGLAPEGAES